MKSQNTNDSYKNRRLETFTGVNNLDFQHKREILAPEPVKDQTNIYGAVFNPNMDFYKNIIENGKRNNVGPVEKEQIGRGVGVDPSVRSAGGFHVHFEYYQPT